MALASLAEYGAMHGASKQAAAKWKAKGALVVRDGKIDVEGSDRRMAHAGLGRFKSSSTAAAAAPSTVNQPRPVDPVVGEIAAGGVDLSNPDHVKTLTAFVERLLTGDFADATTAAVVKENALALKHVLAARREAGQLIDLETAEQVLFEAARLTRDAWLNFPSRTGPRMAASLGIDSDKLVEALTAHVHQQLADIGEPEADFRGARSAEAGLSQGADAAT